MNTIDKHLGQDDVIGRILSNPDDCCSTLPAPSALILSLYVGHKLAGLAFKTL